jgi:hypothetical protein
LSFFNEVTEMQTMETAIGASPFSPNVSRSPTIAIDTEFQGRNTLTVQTAIRLEVVPKGLFP